MRMLQSSSSSSPSTKMFTTRRSLHSLVTLLLFSLSLFPILTQAALFSKNSKVIQLTSSNFNSQVLNIQKPTMVAFTAPWCGHCQKLVPEYERAAKSLDGIIKFTNIDCDEESNKPTCSKYGVKGFPTLKMFPPTKKRLAKDYNGGRDTKSIVDYSVDQLPLGTKKLKAEELISWVQQNSDSPKVILFSTKHTSSPMYKSLALDYRDLMKFAFLKADVAAVRSSARIHLGLDIKDDSDLPVLVAIPSLKGEEFEKGNFLKYDGKIGYHEIKNWLEEIEEKVGVERETSKSKSKSKPKFSNGKSKSESKKVEIDSSNQKQKKGDGIKLGKMSSSSSGNPEKGSYEWKAEKTKESKEKEKLEKEEKRKRFSEAQEKTKRKLEEVQKKERGEKVDAKKLVFGENDSQASRSKSKSKSKSVPTPNSEYVEEAESNPIVSAAASIASVGQETFSTLTDAGKDAYEYVSTETKEVLDDLLDSVSETKLGEASKDAYEFVSNESKKVLDDLKDNVVEASDKIKEAIGFKEKNSNEDSSDSFGTKSDSHLEDSNSDSDSLPDWDATKSKLFNTFKSFMSSENVDLEEEYSADLKSAKEDALRLFKESPEKAIQMAKDSEEWLMKNFQVDKDTMNDLLGNFQKENLNDMLDLVKERFGKKVKDGVKGYSEILEEEEEEWKRKERLEEEKEKERLRKKSHDEL